MWWGVEDCLWWTVADGSDLCGDEGGDLHFTGCWGEVQRNLAGHFAFQDNAWNPTLSIMQKLFSQSWVWSSYGLVARICSRLWWHLVPVLSWVIWWGLAFCLQDREAVCIQWITKFIVLLLVGWFCRRLAQLLSEGVCNGRSESPLLSVAVCNSSKGEHEITLCIWGLWLASAGGYHYSWFTLASHIPQEVFLIFSKYFQVVKLKTFKLGIYCK